jgi:protease-4
MQTIEVTGTMNKIGVRADTIKSGPQKAAGSPFETLTPEQREVFQEVVDQLYAQFIDVVAAGRPKLSREKILELADGRIYTAPQALEHGLIDKIGSMEDAVQSAKRLAGIRSALVVSYARPYGYRANYYAQPWAPPADADINLLNLDLGRPAASEQAPFMYLWQRP